MLRVNNRSSIWKKTFLTMLAVTLISISFVTAVAMTISYRAMRGMLIADRRVSTRWLQDRLNTEISDKLSCFYQIETDKSVKNSIVQWCTTGRMETSARIDVIAQCNSIISLNSDINEIDIYNLSYDVAIKAARTGASSTETGDDLEFWEKNAPYNQTNIVYLPGNNEILICHRLMAFESRMPLALIVIHTRPYRLEDLLEDILAGEDETVVVFNEKGEIISSIYGAGWEDDETAEAGSLIEGPDSREEIDRSGFWFYRPVSRGKLKILYYVPAATVMAALLPTLSGGVVSGLIAAALSFVLSMFFSRTVTRPIIDLSEKMKTAILTDNSQKVNTDRNDEIGILQSSFNTMVERNRDLIRKEYQSKLEKRNAQLKTLQAQINPHFMYNTLQVIGGMALEKGAGEVYDMTIALSDIMRYALNFRNEMVPLREEVHYLESYVYIQNERFENRVTLFTDLEPGTDGIYVPKLILQPICENSFRHGFPGKSGGWDIHVSSSISEDLLVLTVWDNGTGMNGQELERVRSILKEDVGRTMTAESHIGLSNVNMRIHLMYQDPRCGLTIDSKEGEGTTVSIRLQKGKEEGGNV